MLHVIAEFFSLSRADGAPGKFSVSIATASVTSTSSTTSSGAALVAAWPIAARGKTQ